MFFIIFYYRKKLKATKGSGKLEVKTGNTPYYSTVTSPCYSSSSSSKPATTPYYSTITPPCYASSHYSRLQHNSAPAITPIQKSTSDNCLAFYEKIYPKHQNNNPNDDYASQAAYITVK